MAYCDNLDRPILHTISTSLAYLVSQGAQLSLGGGHICFCSLHAQLHCLQLLLQVLVFLTHCPCTHLQRRFFALSCGNLLQSNKQLLFYLVLACGLVMVLSLSTSLFKHLKQVFGYSKYTCLELLPHRTRNGDKVFVTRCSSAIGCV